MNELELFVKLNEQAEVIKADGEIISTVYLCFLARLPNPSAFDINLFTEKSGIRTFLRYEPILVFYLLF